MNPPREIRRGWLYLIAGAMLIVGLVLLLYLPVASSWSSRTSGTGFKDDPAVDYVVVERNWPMRQLPFLYDPLMRTYAGTHEWKFFGYKTQMAYPPPEVISLVFARDRDSRH